MLRTIISVTIFLMVECSTAEDKAVQIYTPVSLAKGSELSYSFTELSDESPTTSVSMQNTNNKNKAENELEAKTVSNVAKFLNSRHQLERNNLLRMHEKTFTSTLSYEKPTVASTKVPYEEETVLRSVENDENSKEDMEVAETVIFRPLFSYRRDSASRQRG